MGTKVCPWYIGYFLACPLRRLIHDPIAILRPFVREGMVVLEVGPGMGFFSLPLARLAGPRGRVVCVDLQERMLAALGRRSSRAGLAGIIETRPCSTESLHVDDLAGTVDFALAFAVVHEVPDQKRCFEEIHRSLKGKGVLLLSEPTGHVTPEEFDRTVALAEGIGLRVCRTLKIRGCLSVAMERV